MYEFGSGYMNAKPNGGNMNTNPTATNFGTLQDVSVDFDFDNKELYGQSQSPVAVAKAKLKIACKASFATINAKTFADLHWGQALAAGAVLFALNVSGTIPSSTAYTITAAPPSSGTFVDDQGVFYALTGIAFVNVASGPTVGQYSYNMSTGVYTFAAADAGVAILYNYTYSTTTGYTLSVGAELMGYGPEFSAFLTQNYQNNQHNLQLLRCISSKLNFKTKTEDFTIPEMDFMAFQTLGGQVFKEYFAQ